MRVWMMALAALAGLFGAAGVGLAAAAAHIVGDTTLHTAADFLLFHAAALFGLVALMRAKAERGLLVAGSLIALGAILFCGDLAIRAMAGLRLMPMAAPTGGMLMIAGWLVAAVAAPWSLRKTGTRHLDA
ncbi:DUF423 domain-containing protein [Beijerinckia sp. L45]|uniref:DUF423 domain-containing protein n=1 Tax=Beijerinckia sp. L45 TaxID=1641855 RepID=UPI00131D0413|nr:DUF423 domain-containing protein [Beijerinckia sp. L45]